jgi:hypothetical protein
MLTPWPGDGHPGAMTLEQKSSVRRDAAEHGRPVQALRDAVSGSPGGNG